MRYQKVLTVDTQQGRACCSSSSRRRRLVLLHLLPQRERQTSCCCSPPPVIRFGKTQPFFPKKAGQKLRPLLRPKLNRLSSSRVSHFHGRLHRRGEEEDGKFSVEVAGARSRPVESRSWWWRLENLERLQCGATQPPHRSTAPTGKL